MMGMPWEKVEITWGDTSKNLPWSCVSGGSQTTHAMTRAAHAAASDAIKKLQQIAAKDLGGRPEDYVVANERVSRKGGGAGMTLAHAAQRAIELGGIYDGHEVPKDINAFTKRSAAALAGQGLMGVARDTYPRDGELAVFRARRLPKSRWTSKRACTSILDFLCVADVGTVIHPAALGGQILGRSMSGHRPCHRPEVGVRPALRRGARADGSIRTNRPQFSMRRRTWSGRRSSFRIRRRRLAHAALASLRSRPVAAAVLNAISAAVGDEVFRRAPVNLDGILAALEAGKPMMAPLTANV